MKINIVHISIYCFLLSMFSSCHSDVGPVENYSCGERSSLVISSTLQCELGYDSMTIDSKTIRYYNSCQKNLVLKEYPIACEDWNSLLQKLNLYTLITLNYHSCNICVDGCDVSIAVTTDKVFHKLTFGTADADKPKEIKEFADEIEARRTAMQSDFCK